MLTQRDKNILPGGRDHETAMRLLNESGAVLQWRDPRVSSSSWLYWCSLDSPPFSEHLEWRIRPKTLRYRVGKYSSKSGDVRLCFVEDAGNEAYWKGYPAFIEWIADWQEVEV